MGECMKKRTEEEWRSYLKKIHVVALDGLARKWGMNCIAYDQHYKPLNKDGRIELLLIHLDVIGKVSE
jgi:hypothetical protein